MYEKLATLKLEHARLRAAAEYAYQISTDRDASEILRAALGPLTADGRCREDDLL